MTENPPTAIAFNDAAIANRQAELYATQGKIPEAIACCHQSLKLDPNFAPAYKTLGDLLRQQNKIEPAIRAYQTAIALQPYFVLAYWNLAQLFNSQKQLKEAIYYQQQTLKLNSNLVDPESHNELGVALAQRGNLEEAINFYHNFVKSKPHYAPAYLNLGTFLQQQGEIEEAIACFRKTIAVKSDFAEGYFNLGNALARGGETPAETEEAIACFRQAIALQPKMGRAYFKLGGLLQEMGNRQEAIACFQKAIALQPDRVEAYNNLGILLRQEENHDGAIACFTKAIQINPSFAEAYRNLGTSFQYQGQLDLACQCIKQAIAIQPDFALAYGNLGYVLEQQGKLDEASFYLRKAIALQPNLAMAYGNLGNILHQQGKLEEAIACFQTALKYDSEFGYFYFRGQRHLEEIDPTSFVEIPVKHPKKIAMLTREIATNPRFDPHNPQLTCIDVTPRTPVHLSAGKTIPIPDRAIAMPEMQGYSPETYVAIVPNGRAWGDLFTSAIVSEDNYILADISTGNVPYLFSLEKLTPVHYFDETVAFLSVIGGETFYHWFVDLMPRVDILCRSGIELDAIDKFAINDYVHPFQKQTLSALGIPESKIITSVEYPHIQAKRLIVPSVPSSTEKWFGPFIEGPPKWVCDFLRNMFLPVNLTEAIEPLERIYITRIKAKFRRFINEDEVSQSLEYLGFTPVVLESLTVAQQMYLMANAKVIIAPHGAGLTNSIFCQSGTKIIEIFSPRYIRECYWIVANHIGLDYYYLIGDDPESYYRQHPDRRPKPVNRPARTEHIFVNIDELLKLMQFAGVA